LGVSLGGFDPPPLGSLVCDHYTTNGWFRSTSSNPPVCGHYTTMTCLIYAPSSFARFFHRTYLSQPSPCPSSHFFKHLENT